MSRLKIRKTMSDSGKITSETVQASRRQFTRSLPKLRSMVKRRLKTALSRTLQEISPVIYMMVMEPSIATDPIILILC
jgi:hypothetical protein